jgi:hypothetical protein
LFVPRVEQLEGLKPVQFFWCSAANVADQRHTLVSTVDR